MTELAVSRPVSVKARLFGVRVRPLTLRRWAAFKANRRGFLSAIVFLILFVTSLFAELIANDRPILVMYNGGIYWPVFTDYPETTFGGTFTTGANYKDPFVQKLIDDKGWAVWPPIPFNYRTAVAGLPGPAPTAPDNVNWLGTDDNARDVLARVIYGFRISVLFGLVLTITSTVIGVLAGAVQGFYGGWVDLFVPALPGDLGWPALPLRAADPVQRHRAGLLDVARHHALGVLDLAGGVVRAEFLRTRNFEYVRAAKAMGMSDWRIMTKHILPNALVATLTFLPFTLSGRSPR